MAKRTITGLRLKTDAVEWATLLVSAERTQSAGAGQAALARPPPSPAAGAPAAEGGAPPSLAAQLKTALKGVRGDIALGLPAEPVLLRTVSLPTADRTELAGMVQLQVDKFAPFPLDQLVVSHEVLRTEGDHSVVLIAAVREDLVNELARPLQEAGAEPRRVDSTLLAWWRLMRDAGETGGESRHVAVILEDGPPQIVVFQGGVPLVMRTAADIQGLTEEDAAREVAQEVGFTLMTLELEHGAGAADLTLWTRGGEGHALLESQLALQTGRVTRKSLDTLPPLCEGLARRGAESGTINLVPEAWLTARSARRFRTRLLATLGAALGVWLLAALGVLGGLYVQRLRLNALQAELGRLHGPSMEVRDLRRRVVMVQRYADTGHSALECLRQISEILPAGVELTSFSYTKGESVKLLGEATDNGLIYEFKDRLDDAKLFTSAALGSQSQNRSRNKWSFDIELKLPKEKE